SSDLREEYELDDKQLYEQVLQLINKLNQDALNK
ncbi:colicin immunity domain-containing protein, partial [Yersinia wautersii]